MFQPLAGLSPACGSPERKGRGQAARLNSAFPITEGVTLCADASGCDDDPATGSASNEAARTRQPHRSSIAGGELRRDRTAGRDQGASQEGGTWRINNGFDESGVSLPTPFGLPPSTIWCHTALAMDPDPTEPLAALLTFLALGAAAYPAYARLESLASASPSRLVTGLLLALQATGLATALAGMQRVRSTTLAAERWRRFRQWAVFAGCGGSLAWWATFLIG